MRKTRENMKNENYSNELNRLLTFMEEKLADEMPTAIFNLDYFVLAILDQKDSFIYKRLDDNLTSMTMETLFNAYYELVKSVDKLSKKEIKFSYNSYAPTEFKKILEVNYKSNYIHFLDYQILDN